MTVIIIIIIIIIITISTFTTTKSNEIELIKYAFLWRIYDVSNALE